MFSSTPSETDVDLEICSINKAVSILKDRSDILAEGTLAKIQEQTDRRGKQLQAELHTTRMNTVSTLLGTQQLSSQVSQVENIVQPIPDKIEGIQQSISDIREEIVTSEQATINAFHSMANRAGIEVQNNMARMCMEMWRIMEARMEASHERAQRRENHLLQFVQLLELEVEKARTPQLMHAPRHDDAPSSQDLLGILSAPLGVITRDFDIILRQGLQLTPADQGQAQWLFNSDRFWRWFSPASSDLLLVHGSSMIDPGRQFCITSLSIFCATLASFTIQKAERDTVMLYFFCGKHMSSIDDLTGPQGLMRCLIARLVIELEAKYGRAVNLNFINEPYAEELRRHDVQHLCNTFCSILAQFPQKATVYCILDGITLYERSEMIEDLFVIMRSLLSLVNTNHSGPFIKVLFTSPFRSRRIAPETPEAQQIVLPPEPRILSLPSERMLSSYLGRRSFEVPEYATSANQSRWVANQENEEWTIEDYT